MDRSLTGLAHDETLDSRFDQDPYPTFARLRETEGLWWSDEWGAWVASRYDDVREALAHDGTALSAVGQTSVALSHLASADHVALESLDRLFSSGLLWSDPPDHTRIRATVNKVLDPRSLERMEPRVVDIVERAIATLPLHEPFDVVERFAAVVPVTVLAELLGVPTSDVPRVRGWADRLARFMGDPRPSRELALDAQAAVLDARSAVTRLVDEGAEGVIGSLAGLIAAGAPITDDEFHATIIVLLVGGHRTTAAGIASGILALARDPALRDELRSDPTLLPGAVEELLRYESPHQRTVRIVRRPMTLGGTELREGDVILLMNGSANRDERRFDHPERLTLRPDARRHLSFSAGIHFCIGASLARLELVAALRAFLARYPGYRVLREPRWLDNRTLRTVTELWIEPGTADVAVAATPRRAG
jgi:cytochrome P450